MKVDCLDVDFLLLVFLKKIWEEGGKNRSPFKESREQKCLL